jgi:aminoglycoside N3'-acetyltransferase
MRLLSKAGLKAFVQTHLGPSTQDRLSILADSFSRLRRTFTNRARYPIPVEEIHTTLRQLGIQRGDTVHMHSSVSSLYAGSFQKPKSPAPPVLQYVGEIVEMLLQLLGSEGTLLMNTDSIKNVFVQLHEKTVFDYAREPSRRGLISERFRRRKDVIRSVHPWYNVTGWGRQADPLVREHEKSTPYTMDRNSPWAKLIQCGGKVVLLGHGYAWNSPIHLAEYLHPDEYPLPVFLSRPIGLRYVGYDRQTREMPVLLHAPLWHPGAEVRFAQYLQQKYGFYRLRQFDAASIVAYDAKDQYDRIVAEMRAGVTWYDPSFW